MVKLWIFTSPSNLFSLGAGVEECCTFGSWTRVCWKAAEDPLRKQGLEGGIKLLVQVKGSFPGEKYHFNMTALMCRKVGPLLSLLLGENGLVVSWFGKNYSEHNFFVSVCLQDLLPSLVGDIINPRADHIWDNMGRFLVCLESPARSYFANERYVP